MAAGLVVAVVAGVGLTGRSRGAAPEIGTKDSTGTVSFDHVVHASDYAMPCLGCHVYATHSPNAGLPSARKCMGCHKFIAKEKPAVQALAAMFEKGEAPHWQRVTRLPDFIYFSHRMHIRNQIACADCHGEVKDMHAVRSVVEMNMGFCLACHAERNATVDCVACHK